MSYLAERDIVYVATNETMPFIVKIGYSGDPDYRMASLYSGHTGVLMPYSIKYDLKVPKGKGELFEKQCIHKLMQDKRFNPNREGFGFLVDMLTITNDELIDTKQKFCSMLEEIRRLFIGMQFALDNAVIVGNSVEPVVESIFSLSALFGGEKEVEPLPLVEDTSIDVLATLKEIPSKKQLSMKPEAIKQRKRYAEDEAYRLRRINESKKNNNKNK